MAFGLGLGDGRRASAALQAAGVLAHVVERAGQEEGLLGQIVGLALEDLLKRGDGVLDRHVAALAAGEDLRHEERLAHEALQAARSRDGLLLLLRQLVDAEDGDDVLQVAVGLQYALRLARHLVVLLPHDVGIQHARGRGQRVHRRIDAQLGQVALEADRRVEVAEGRRRRRVGVVVGRHEDRLQRGDRALLGRGDALLQAGHLGRQVGLVADRRRHPAEQRRHLRAGLREAEDVVDEEQHVAALVAEELGHRQAGQAHPQACTGRLVHLAEDHHRLLDDARLGHLVDQVVALARALADAGEDGVAAVLLGNVADQLLDDDRLAYAGAAEDADLAALGEGRDQVDHLEAGLEDLGRRRLVLEVRCRAVDGVALVGLDRALVVDRLAEHVEDASQRRRADGHADRRAGVDRLGAAGQAVRRGHRHCAHPVVAEMLLDLADERITLALNLDGVEDGGHVAGAELDVDDGAGDGDDPAGGGSGYCHDVLGSSFVTPLRTPARRSRSRSSRA